MAYENADWATRWSRTRQHGRSHFLLRFFIVNGLLPGALGAGLLVFVQPRVGEQNIGSPGWAFLVFCLFSVYGFLWGKWWWLKAEKRFLERNPNVGS